MSSQFEQCQAAKPEVISIKTTGGAAVAVQRRNLEVVGSNPAGCWAFFLLLSILSYFPSPVEVHLNMCESNKKWMPSWVNKPDWVAGWQDVQCEKTHSLCSWCPAVCRRAEPWWGRRWGRRRSSSSRPPWESSCRSDPRCPRRRRHRRPEIWGTTSWVWSLFEHHSDVSADHRQLITIKLSKAVPLG